MLWNSGQKVLDLLSHKKYNLIVAQKVGDDLSPQMGRPKVANPKTIEVKARIDAETDRRLVEYCEKNGVTKTEVVRKGISLVLGEKK